MGRLGFNLVHHKESDDLKNVESGLPSSPTIPVAADQQQNERNVGAEISELIIAIDERNRTIKNLRLLLGILATMLICLGAYTILLQYDRAELVSRAKNIADIVDAAQAHSQKMSQNLSELFDAYKQQLEDQPPEVNERIMLLQQDLEAQKSLRAKEQHETLQMNEDLMRNSEQALAKEREEKENKLNEMQNELNKVTNQRDEMHEELIKTIRERDSLREELETSEKVAKATAMDQKQEPKTPSTTSTTDRPAETTTISGSLPLASRLFNSDRFKRINDFAKEIENVGRFFGNAFRDLV